MRGNSAGDLPVAASKLSAAKKAQPRMQAATGTDWAAHCETRRGARPQGCVGCLNILHAHLHLAALWSCMLHVIEHGSPSNSGDHHKAF